MMYIIKRDITEELLNCKETWHLINTLIHDMFTLSGAGKTRWIAGGFARHVYQLLYDDDKNVIDAFKYFVNRNSPYETDLVCRSTAAHNVNTYLDVFRLTKDDEPIKGDIDIFVKKDEQIETSIKVIPQKINDICSFKFLSHKDYLTKLSKTCRCVYDIQFQKIKELERLGRGQTQVNVQVIHHEKLRYSSIEELFQAFDIHNSCYAISLENDRIFLNFTEEAIIADKQKVVHIKRNNNPLLPNRLFKYIKHRGCTNGLSESSIELFTNWCLNARNNAINCELLEYQPNYKIALEKLISLDCLTQKQILLFLFKWETVTKNSIINENGDNDYIHMISDWASNHIK